MEKPQLNEDIEIETESYDITDVPYLYGTLRMSFEEIEKIYNILAKESLPYYVKWEEEELKRFGWSREDFDRVKQAVNRIFSTLHFHDQINFSYQKPIEITESDIENFLISHITLLEDNLILIGNQYKTSIGFIDILCKDIDNNFVVIELKRHRCSDKVVGQLQRYLVWVKESLTKKENVRGIIFIKNNNLFIKTSIRGSRFPIKIITFKDIPYFERIVEKWKLENNNRNNRLKILEKGIKNKKNISKVTNSKLNMQKLRNQNG